MKLLLDECVNEKLCPHLIGHDAVSHDAVSHGAVSHDVYTVGYLGWKSIKNGVLLRTAAEAGFDALITVDQSMIDQHNPATLPLAVVLLRPEKNLLADLIALVPDLTAALATLTPKTFLRVERRKT